MVDREEWVGGWGIGIERGRGAGALLPPSSRRTCRRSPQCFSVRRWLYIVYLLFESTANAKDERDSPTSFFHFSPFCDTLYQNMIFW